jgi:hypothetical protein
MAQLPAIEISCSYTVVDAVPLNPFAWAILRALRDFPVGSRPGFDLLSEKLRIGDASFIEQAWEECVSWGLVIASSTAPRPEKAEVRHGFRPLIFAPLTFQHAEINQEGEQAMARGYIAQGRPVRRTGEALYFLLFDGAVVNWRANFSVKGQASAKKPIWADSLTPARITEAIAAQYKDESTHIASNQRIESLSIDWGDSRQVIISTSLEKTTPGA